MFIAAVSASNPSPLWFATRGAGVVTQVLLTGVVILGIATSLRLEGKRTPRFVTATVHRNLSLFSIVLLAVHIATSVLDPFASIKATDALIPFLATYRPFWLGLGVLAAEILTAVAVTSIARGRIGPRTWRVIHFAAYASWPLAIVHGLGTGTDAREPWLIGLTVGCVAAVLLALVDRLLVGRWQTAPVRLLIGGVTAAAVAFTYAWAFRVPLQPGWAAVAGTPSTILSKAPASPGPVHSGNGGFVDKLIGFLTQTPAGAAIGLRDIVDTTLSLSVMPPDATQTLPVVTVQRNGKTVCTAPARVTQTIYAVCGTTRIVIALFGAPAHLTGQLTTSGALP